MKINARQINLVIYINNCKELTAGDLWAQLPSECKDDIYTFINDLRFLLRLKLVCIDGAYVLPLFNNET